MKLATVLSDKVLYSWGGKDIMRKAIVLTSSLPKDADSTMKTALMVRLDYEFVSSSLRCLVDYFFK